MFQECKRIVGATPSVGRALQLALALGLVLSFGSSAFAQAIWAVEGPISAIDSTAGTITANGLTFQVPADLQLVGLSRVVTGSTLNLLEDASAPGATKTILPSPGNSGGTTISEGTIVTAADGTRTFLADFVYVEQAENVLSGVIDAVNADGSIVVNGTAVAVSTDERFLGVIGDIGAEPITLEELSSLVGAAIVVEGYYSSGDSTLYAVAGAADYLPPPPPGEDIVRIEFCQARISVQQVRAVGVVAPFDPLNPTVISVFDGTTGALFGTTTAVLDVDGRGSWSFRMDGVTTLTQQQTVRAVSANGGEHTCDAQIRP